MDQLIAKMFAPAFANPLLAQRHDGALINLNGRRLAFTTDSYVVHPLFFPGGDIGKLAVNGTVNDLATSGALPLHLSCGMVLEAADRAGVSIVTGDTKVVERGSADKLFINTSGIGIVPAGINVSASRAR